MTTPNDGQPSYAAGWYADVNVPGTERWYDGTGWTEHVRAMAAPVVPPVPVANAADAAGGFGYAAPGADATGYAAPATGVAGYAAPGAGAGAGEYVAPGAVANGYAAPTTAFAVPAAGAAGSAVKQPWYKRKAIVIPVAVVGGLFVVGVIAGVVNGGKGGETVADKPAVSQESKQDKVAVEEIVLVMVDVPDVVGMTGADAEAALSALGLKVDAGRGDLSMPVTAQDVAAGTQAEEGSTVRLTLQEKAKLTIGQNNALRSATQYLDYMHFSRSGLIQQLTSEYGEGYPAEDAEFAVATLEQTGKVDWNAEAAEAAQSYLDMMAFSREGLYDQLTSDYGEGFTAEQANAGLAAVGY